MASDLCHGTYLVAREGPIGVSNEYVLMVLTVDFFYILSLVEKSAAHDGRPTMLKTIPSCRFRSCVIAWNRVLGR